MPGMSRISTAAEPFPDNVVDKDVHQVSTIGDKGSVNDVVECKEYTRMFNPLYLFKLIERH
jgi:hypothetical protein